MGMTSISREASNTFTTIMTPTNGKGSSSNSLPATTSRSSQSKPITEGRHERTRDFDLDLAGHRRGGGDRDCKFGQLVGVWGVGAGRFKVSPREQSQWHQKTTPLTTFNPPKRS